MTWDEFKTAIDRQLSIRDLDGSVSVWYIDVSYPEVDDTGHKFPNVKVRQGELHVTCDMR